MIATAASRSKRRIWAEIRIRRTGVEIELPEFPNSVSRRWPAIMLAARRMASVAGRMTFLIVSITTINGIKGPGVPRGTKWANMWLVWLNHP